MLARPRERGQQRLAERMDDRIVRAQVRRQVEPRPLPAADVVHRFLEQRARHVEMQAVERALQIGHPVAVEIVNRDRARAVRDERRAAAVEPQILFAERAQLQHDEIRILQLVRRGEPAVAPQRLQPDDADLPLRQRLRDDGLPHVGRDEIGRSIVRLGAVMNGGVQ